MTQPIDAQFDQDELSTNHKFNMIDTQSPHNPSPIQLTAAHPGPNTAGSDGSVNPFNGHRTYAYCIQIDGIRYSRATRYPPSTYSTSHRSKLEGAMTAATHHTYFTKKYHVTQATYDNIDWDVPANPFHSPPTYISQRCYMDCSTQVNSKRTCTKQANAHAAHGHKSPNFICSSADTWMVLQRGQLPL